MQFVLGSRTPWKSCAFPAAVSARVAGWFSKKGLLRTVPGSASGFAPAQHIRVDGESSRPVRSRLPVTSGRFPLPAREKHVDQIRLHAFSEREAVLSY